MQRVLSLVIAISSLISSALGALAGLLFGSPDPVYDIVISEVMASNKTLCLGCDDDWVEIYNGGNTAVTLDGYYLTDDLNVRDAYPLSGVTIEAGGYAVVIIGDDAPFGLSSDGEAIYITKNGIVTNVFKYTGDIGYGSYTKDGASATPTPGFANTEDGYISYLESLTLPPVIISEVISSNSKYMPVETDDGAGYYDMVEIYNRSDLAVNLAHYTLSDKKKEPDRYRFPEKSLQPGEYFVVYCSGTSKDSSHAPFKIGSDGEILYLSDDDGIIDVMAVPGDLKKNESYGRNGKRLVYMNFPTFGKENKSGYISAYTPPLASVASGIYDSAFTVTLDGAGTVYYTLDGSRPTVYSEVYKEPVKITENCVLRAIAYSGRRYSEVSSYTYLIDVEHTLPVVSVGIPDEYLHGDGGILDTINKNIEKEAVLTLFEDGEERFTISCGFRLHGNDSRKGAKQNFQLRFRSEYGASKLRCKVFDTLDIDEFNSLLLKSGSEDYTSAMMRDELAASVVNGATSLYVQDYKPVILYLAGEYYGIYYIRERFSDDYVASHLNVSAESVDLLSIAGHIEDGDADEYEALLDYISGHDLSNDRYYKYVAEKIDVQSLIDWYVCRSYMGDRDYANIRYFRTDEGDGKWRWMFYDLDWAFWNANDAPVTSILKPSSINTIVTALLKNQSFRDRFLKRYAELMSTVLNEETFNRRIDDFVSVLSPEIARDRARWGFTVEQWSAAVEKIRAYFRDGARDRTVLTDVKRYFGLSDEQMKEYFGKTV
ncbi:MAG: CotH kinase family protein [Clostridia bacterium]|nr:CotH kinase family protein [Clostridia bacterium]